MEKIAIVTDSTCDLDQALMDQYGIKAIPLRIVYKDREFRDQVDIKSEDIYALMPQEVPKTSLPTPEDALKVLNELVDAGFTHILGIFISSGLSGTFNMMHGLAEDFKEATLEFIDSKSLSLGLGFSVMDAAKNVKAGLPFDEIVTKAKLTCSKTKTFYVIKTLEYLKAGGRIGKVEGTIGELLDIKPVISINEEGVYYTLKKVRGRKKSIHQLIELVQERATSPVRVGVLHGMAEQEALEIKAIVDKIEQVKEVFFAQISPVLTVHTGPGLLGIVIQELT